MLCVSPARLRTTMSVTSHRVSLTNILPTPKGCLSQCSGRIECREHSDMPPSVRKYGDRSTFGGENVLRQVTFGGGKVRPGRHRASFTIHGKACCCCTSAS